MRFLDLFIFSLVALLPATRRSAVEIAVVYNNVPGIPGFPTDWGLSCAVKAAGKFILFDTGSSPALLRGNLERLGFRPGDIDAVVLSHRHLDHCGGITAVLRAGLTIYIPASFPPSVRSRLAAAGAEVVEVEQPVAIAEGVWSTGEVPGPIPEQGLVVESPRGLIVLVGCSHPGVEKMVGRALSFHRKPVYLLTGGFHLRGAPAADVQVVIDGLKTLGVKKIAPNHCTGAVATDLFKKAWGEDFLRLGAGDSFVVESPWTGAVPSVPGRDSAD